MLKRWTVLPAIHIMNPIIIRFLNGACATSQAFCAFHAVSESLRWRAPAASSASGADLVKPGGSGTAGEEEEASGSSTAQWRARPFPFSIAGGPRLGDRRPGAPPPSFLWPSASGLETGTSALGEPAPEGYKEGGLRLPPIQAIANRLITAVVEGYLSATPKI